MSKSSKERSTGSMAGYFETEFKPLRASYIDPISMRRQARNEEKKRNIVSRPFVTMSRAKDPYVIRRENELSSFSKSDDDSVLTS